MDIETLASGAAGLYAAWSKYGGEISAGIKKRLGAGATDKLIAKFWEAWERVDWQLTATKYQTALAEMYGTIRILGKAELVSLEGIFTDVHILEEPTAFQRYDIRRLRQNPRELERRKKRKGGLQLVKDPFIKRIFILGKPGAGKTTFLKYLTIQAAKGNIERTPIFVPLKEWADSGLLLMDFIVRLFDICNFPKAEEFVEHILQNGNVMVLFDGLDEVNQEGNQRSKMIAELKDFSNKYSTTQCLITCRIAATEYAFDRFVYVELADFSDKQVNQFVKKWFKGSRKKRALFEDAFSRPENQRLQELARTPLLLSLICLSFDATLEFPQRRVEIYDEALEVLLKKWDTSRSIKRDEIYHGLSLGRKRQMFARIAAQSFQEGKYFFREDELSRQIVSYLRQLPYSENDIDGQTILKAIEAQHGIFSERAHKIYSFSHLTFQEYFTAKQIVADTTGKALRALLTPDNLFDDRWREVILLTVSLLDTADDFFEVFLSLLPGSIKNNKGFRTILTWSANKSKDDDHKAALIAYYCYVLLSLMQPEQTPSRRHDSIVEASLRLAKRLNRSGTLTESVLVKTKTDIRKAYRSLRSGKYESVEAIDESLVDVDSAIGVHLSHLFIAVLSIINLSSSPNIESLRRMLRDYVIELRKYAMGIAEKVNFGTPTRELPSELRLAFAARDLALLPDWAPSRSWVELVEKVGAMLRNTQAINTPEKTSWDSIEKFFYLAHLLLDCLELAVVSDRNEIEGRILLPLAPTKSAA